MNSFRWRELRTYLVELSPNSLTRTSAQDVVLRHVAQLLVLLLRGEKLRGDAALDIADLAQPLVLLRLDCVGGDLGLVRGDLARELLDRADVEFGALALRLGTEGVGERLGRDEVLLAALVEPVPSVGWLGRQAYAVLY